MNALTPETLAAISKALSTLYRASILEISAVHGEPHTTHAMHMHSAATSSFVVGGAILMLAHAADRQANEWREFMHSIDGRLNQIHNAMLDMTRAVEHGVRLNDSEREALRLAVQSELAAIRDEVAEIPGAISEAGTDIGAGIAEGMQLQAQLNAAAYNRTEHIKNETLNNG